MRKIIACSLSLLVVTACSGQAADNPRSSPAPEGGSKMLGAYTAVPTDSDEVVKAAKFAVETINKRSNSVTPYTLNKILSAQSQVVSGVNYALALELVRGQVTEIHDVVVYSQPWTNTLQLTSDTIRP